MNYVWVEDFDGDNKSTEETLVARVKEEYKIVDDVEIIRTFPEALEYFNAKTSKFDLVLLDINLLDSNGATIQDKLYQQYFKDKITRLFYDKYYEKSKGILLFQYLREVLKFPRERIAFLSAYVPDQFTKDYKLVFPEKKEAHDVKRIYQEFHETVMENLSVEPLAFPKPNLSEKNLSPLEIQEYMLEGLPLPEIRNVVNEQARTAFIESFSRPNTTECTVFRRCAIGCAELLIDRLEQNKTPQNNKFFAYMLTAMPKSSDYTWEHLVIVLNRMINSSISPTTPQKEDDCVIIVEYLRDWDIFSICEGLPPISTFGSLSDTSFDYVCTQNSLWKELSYYRNNNTYTMAQFIALSCCKHFRNWVTHTKIMETENDVKLYTFLLLMSFRAYYATDKLDKEQQRLFYYSFMRGLGDVPTLPERRVIEETLKKRLFDYNQQVSTDSAVLRHLSNYRNLNNKSLQHYMKAFVPISHLQFLVSMTTTNLTLEDVLDLYLSLYTKVSIPKTKKDAPLGEVSYEEVSVTIHQDHFPVEGTLDHALFSFAYSYLYG